MCTYAVYYRYINLHDNTELTSYIVNCAKKFYQLGTAAIWLKYC